jgi:hypothetical protein
LVALPVPLERDAFEPDDVRLAADERDVEALPDVLVPPPRRVELEPLVPVVLEPDVRDPPRVVVDEVFEATKR